MSMNFTWRLKILITVARKPKVHLTFGIVERFHKTLLDEFYRVAFRKKVYRSIDELQADLDAWIKRYNEERPHQGRCCKGQDTDADLQGQPRLSKGETNRRLSGI